MKHPRWIHAWRNHWNPPSVFHENQARKTFEHGRKEMDQKLASLETGRQQNMPAFWVSYSQVAAAVVATLVAMLFVIAIVI